MPSGAARVGGDEARAALEAAYTGLAAVVSALGPADRRRPTLCAGWRVEALLFHCLLDPQRALVALATPTTEPVDVDFVTYWRDYQPGDPGARAHARFVRRVAAAVDDWAALAGWWAQTAQAMLQVVAAAPVRRRLATQGHVLTLPDLAATLAVEATIHHLDLAVAVPDAGAPAVAALQMVRRTLDGLLGTAPPLPWDDVAYALKGTGRMALTRSERARLGERAQAFPLLA